jgi:trans-2,3-dihydro-3-hydroxyanthranilate isomerase
MTEALERLAAFVPPGAGTARGYLILDVFAAHPLQGNQLAVFGDGRGIDGARMQAIARELNLSETVFVLPAEGESGGDGDARIRIFTPAVELPFAGHPVLGAGVALAAALDRESVVLETGAGPIAVDAAAGDGAIRAGEMRQPVPSWEPFARERDLLAALGVPQAELPVDLYTNGPRHIMVALASEQAVAALDPDQRMLAAVAGAAGVSCFAGAGGRFKTRMFAPGLGVPEDPATGSAAGPLAVHCARHGRGEPGTWFEIRQGEEISRPSLLRARVDGPADAPDAVRVAGDVVMLGRGQIVIG